MFKRLLLAYCRGPNHPGKLRLVGWIARWCLPVRGIVLNVCGGLRMRLQVINNPERSLFLTDTYEALTTRFVVSNLAQGSIAAIAGANLGYYALQMARAVGATGRVLGVEPLPANLARCWENICLNPALAPRVVLVSGALGSTGGYLPVVPPPEEHTGLAMLERTGEASLARVRVERFDDLTRVLKFPVPDLMVLDVEGWELEAAAGFGSAQPGILVVENDPRAHARQGRTEVQFLAALQQFGYSLSHLDGRPAQAGDFYPEQTVVAWRPGRMPHWNSP